MGPIGMPEMVVIAVIALIIFGPRKLPELGKSLGKSIAEFKRASNELKNTLEDEIRTEELQDARKSAQIPPTAVDGLDRHRAAPSRRHERPRRRARTPAPETTGMAVVPFPDPQSSKDSSARDVSDSWFDDDDSEGGGKMSFLEHLDELRKRIIRALLSLCVGVGIAAFFIEDIYRVRHAAAAADAPAGRDDDLHTRPKRSCCTSGSRSSPGCSSRRR